MFVKYNTSPFKDILIKEVQGLSCLKSALDKSGNSYLKTPFIHDVGERSLHLEQIVSVPANDKHQYKLGLGLAKLHQLEYPVYGFDENNYIGLNPQKNMISENWGAFFVEQRLQFQIDLIRKKELRESFSSALLASKQNLIDFLNQHCPFPSLLHGDLWNGNVMFSFQEQVEKVWLIDPAVYYGDREVDIAMTEMFGGFSNDFYSVYERFFPLSKAYPEKKIIYNLYHYLNHYNLFGDAYLYECKKAFKVLMQKFYVY